MKKIAIVLTVAVMLAACAAPPYQPYNKYDSYARNLTADSPLRKTRGGEDHYLSALNKRGTPKDSGLFEDMANIVMLGSLATGDYMTGSVGVAAKASDVMSRTRSVTDIDRVTHTFGWVPKAIAPTPEEAATWAFEQYRQASLETLKEMGFTWRSLSTPESKYYSSDGLPYPKDYRGELFQLKHENPEYRCGTGGNRICWFTIRLPLEWIPKNAEKALVPDYLEGSQYHDQPAFRILPVYAPTAIGIFTGNGKERHAYVPEMEFFLKMSKRLPPELAVFLSQYDNLSLGNGEFSEEAYVLQNGKRHRFIF